MMNITKIIIKSLLLSMAVLVGGFVGMMNVSLRSFASSDISTVDTQTYSGEVTRIDGRKLTVTVDNQAKEITVPENISIKRNTMDAKFDDIKVNDRVEWKQSANGTLVSLAVTAGAVFDYGKLAIPAVVLVLLIIGVIAYITKKKNEGHIKTPTEQIN